MKLEELGFSIHDGAFCWKNHGIEQVIQIKGTSKVHSHCEVCVNSVAYKDDASHPLVVCCITWHESSPVVLPSWDLLQTNKAARLSRPAEEIPAEVAKKLESLRTPKSIHTWLINYEGDKPPAFFWLSMLAAHWADEKSSAMVALEQYLKKLTVGSELYNDGLLMKTFLEADRKA